MQGNKLFALKDYKGAIQSYNTAIIKSPMDASIYTNRALCFLRIDDGGNYDDAIQSDCERAIELESNNIKARFFKGKSLLNRGSPWALRKAALILQEAYDICQKVEKESDLVKEITETLLKVKLLKWKNDDKIRRVEESDLYKYLSGLIDSSDVEVQEKAQRHLQLDRMLEQCDDSKARPRTVPEAFIGRISFCLMVDPVISTKSGMTYDKSEILTHLEKVGHFDPFTRQFTRASDLVPNYALKEAIDAFLLDNMWAIDF